MILKHKDNIPVIDSTAYIAPSATICGDVKIGKNTCILHGSSIIAESGTIIIGNNTIILENAVIRSSKKHHIKIGNNILIGPHAHIVGCTIENNVFIATGASIFHGATIGTRSEVRINAVVHIKTVLKPDTIVPIQWIAVGNPATIHPPDKHEVIWNIQKQLDFPGFVYGVDRVEKGKSNMELINKKYRSIFITHKEDEIL